MQPSARPSVLSGSIALLAASAFWLGAPTTAKAAAYYWDGGDATAAGNAQDGTGLGGSGNWDAVTANWWDLSSDVVWGNTSSDTAIFTAAFAALPPSASVTLSTGLIANQLSFLRSGFTLAGGDLTLAGAGAGLHAHLGESATIDSQIQGSAGLTKTGGGFIRLGHTGNSYTGTTTIANGALVITDQGALGADTSTIVVTGFNPSGSTSLRGFPGGSLVLDGTGGGLTITRNLSLQGQGPIGDRGAALVSTGNNTLSGVVDTGVAFGGVSQNTRLIAADGTLTLTGTLNVGGVAATTISNFGGTNQAGASFYNLSGILTGTGTIESSGGGTLFLNPSDTSGFSGTIRVSGSAASGQSVVRIDSPNVLGTRTASGTSSVLDLNGGILAVLMDTPSVLSGGSAANVYGRSSSTIFADHTPNSSVKDQTVAFGQLAYEDNITVTFNSRNGYGMSFGAAPVVGSTAGDNNSTLSNNLQGGGLLSFTGNFWSNANNTGNRTMTISGNGNTLISGNIVASAAAFDHNLTKTGSGTLTITSTGSTLDGSVNVNGGTVAIGDWRAITNNGSTVNIGTGATSGTLSLVGNNVSLSNLTTSKVINLAGTTGGATILANQTGTSPGLILIADFTATGGSASNVKTVTLGGINIGQNTINGAIPNNDAGGTVNVSKIDEGRWVLAGENTYSGATTISAGTLQLKANAATSTIVSDSSALTFNSVNVYAGGTLEFLGQPSVSNVETLGALTPTNGSGTVRLTPGSGGTASLVFSSLGPVGAGGTVNIVAPTSSDTVSFTTAPVVSNIANAGLYYNGSDFAFIDAGVVRAPIYGTDADFATSASALTAGQSNQITGSFSNGALAIDSLQINGSHTLTLSGTLTIRTGAVSGASGGILQTGGSGIITGSNVGTNGAGATTIRVDGGANSLTIDSVIVGTGGWTKSGEGTLILGAANSVTGTISVNEGTVQLSGSGRLAASNVSVTVRQGATIDLNGVTPSGSTNSWNNNGILTNSSPTAVTFNVGGSNGTGTSLGSFTETNGVINILKSGSGAQSWLGLSNYTGTTTIGSTGIITVNNLADGGVASGIGASSSAASNLVFTGASTSQAYGGLSANGTTNDFTDRLFTFNGGANGGARIQANGVNSATLSFTNPGALAFGPAATGNPQGLVLGGGSTSDNRFFPIINDNGAAATSVYKADTGIWYLEATNGYSGVTELRGGTLYAQDGVSLPTASNLVFNRGTLASTGTLTRTIGTGSGQMSFATPAANTAAFRGGFAAGGSKLTVDWGDTPTWGSTASFLDTRDGLIFGAMVNTTPLAKADVELISDFSLGNASGAAATPTVTTASGSSTVTFTTGTTAGLMVGQAISGTSIPSGAYIVSINSSTQISISATVGTGQTGVAATIPASALRPIRVDDNTNIGADFATLSGVVSGNAGTGIRKLGTGILVLSGANTYDGETNVNQGTLVVSSLGNSASPGATSVGDSTNAATTAAITLGNGGTGGAILEYVGLGETSDRRIRLNATTGSTQIHGDGVGGLTLTNVANDLVGGAKTLFLRGVSADANKITSVLADNGGALSVTVDGSTSWILTAANTFSGTTTVGAGALGIGDDAALGGSTLALSNGSLFAFGADRSIGNALTQASATATGFTGDYSLSFTNTLASAHNSSTTWGTNNNIAAGKTLSFADITVDALSANRTWAIDGAGETIIGGDITTTTTFGLAVVKNGDGTLQLNGTGSNFNQNNATLDIDRGTLRLGASGVIPDGAGFGNVVLSPELLNGDTAILDLNGQTETINGLTANSDGTTIIDNSSATAASLIFGANDAPVSFGGGIGTYTIQNSGGGALSITKTGAASVTIPTGVTLNHSGATSVTAGSLTIASPVNATSSLSVLNTGSTLALTGGLTAPGSVTSFVAGDGTTVSLLDGAGNKLNGLTTLQLGSSGGTMTTLNLNVGDLSVAGDELSTDTLTLLSGGALSLFTGNQITFNLTDIGLNPGETYELLNFVDGGFTSGPLANTDYLLGATPGGFSAITLTANNNSVFITTGTLITGTSYWRGALGGGTDTTWNGNANNWSTDKAGTTAALSTPGSGTDVVFQWDAPSNAAVVTTLEQNFKINSLTFEDATVVANTATSITIDPGAIATNRIEIAPQVATDGIKVLTTNATNATLSGPVRLGGLPSSQTWEVSNAGSVLSLGSLQGEKDVTKTGSGRVVLTSPADPTFNSGVTADFTVSSGTLEINSTAALGNPTNSNLANVLVMGSGSAFYHNSAVAGGTLNHVANPLTLGGGTLSVGGNTQIYSGPINVTAASTINMRDSNSATLGDPARSITLSGVLSGSASLTIDSASTLSGGNAESGTVTISNNANTWNGELIMNRGTVVTTAANGLGGGNITFNQLGRIIMRAINGTTYNLPGTMSFSAGAIGEFAVDNTSGVLGADFVVNQNGTVNIGSGAAARFSLADVASQLNVTGGVVLGGNASISVEGGDADSLVTISGVISDGGSGFGLAIHDDQGGWGVTNTILRLTGASTFSGDVTLASGILEFNTVTGIAGAASSLGQGSAINIAGSSTLRFIGTSAQSTDRPITSTAGVITLSANGATAADTITYTRAITVGPTGDGSQIVLTGSAGSQGIVTGGITQTGDSTDATVNGGTWSHQTGTTRIGDDLTVTGASTILNLDSGLFQVRDDFTVTSGANLNLNGTGALSFSTPTLSADASLRAVTGGVITLGANDSVVVANFDSLRIGTDATGVGTLDTVTFNQTVTELLLGNRNLDRSGIILGTGTVTATGNLDLYQGTVHANLASTGTLPLEKIGAATVTLRGNNSGLTATGASIVYDGLLALDYTADNNTKLRAASALDLRGARVNVIGNDSAATTQSVGGLTLASGGSSTIQVIGGASQDAVLNLGAITRGNLAQDGTIRFMLPTGTQSASHGITTTSPNSTFGMLGTGATVTSGAAFATVEDGTGTWFATASGGNVVALASTAKNNVTTWLNGDHITDETTGFTGSLLSANINSLRYQAAGGSDVVMPQGEVLIIGSGGFLITSNVGGTPSMMGGTLAAGTTELVVTQDSAQTFEIGSDIRINHGITKTGTGTLLLSGDNVYTGLTELQEGTLQVTGNGIGDFSIVTLSASRPTTLELLASETIGRLQGGARNTNGDYGTVAVGSHTLTVNNSGGNTTYAGFFTGDGNIVKGGTHNLALSNVSTGFTGVLTVDSGTLLLSGIGQIDASIIRINKGGALTIDNNGTTRSGTRILDTTPITLNSADGTFNGQTTVRGLALRTDQDGTLDETVGAVNLNTGASYVGMEATSSNDDSDLIATSIARFNSSTLNVRGTNLGTTSAQANQFRIGDATNQSSFISTELVGGGGGAGTENISIVPWAIGQTTTGALGTTHMGDSLVTYVSGTGFRPLSFASEYDTLALAAATDNARESLTADLTGLAGTTVNALVVNNNSIAAATHAVSGTGAGQTLAVTSGALLFTLNASAAAGNYGLTLGGFDSGITVGGTEYVIHVVNPDASAPTKALTATIASPLTSSADITKSGRGTLVLSGANTAGGGANRTTLNEGTLEIADLDNIGGNSGALVFAGGTLRFGVGLTDDISQRAISFMQGGATIDTAGISLALANSVGSGLGGLTKIGAGDMTLNAAATYTGATTISGGTLTIGANDATGSGGDVNIGAGATLALGANSITAGLVTTSGASPQITGTGTISAAVGYFLNHTGDTQIDAVLAGTGGLLKAQTNVVTLTGLSTYPGTTEIQSGTLSFDSIANVGGGASALGAPTTVENGIIRMGLTSTATTLTYTGTGSSSDRIIELQGTTGGVTVNANGSGALHLGRIQTATSGNKTLTLSGTSALSLENTVASIKEVGSVLSVTKAGANFWEITGASTYTGNTLISGGGVLRAGDSQSFGTNGTVTLQDTGSTLELADAVDINRPLGVGANGNAKTLRLQSGATIGTYSGTIGIGETGPGNFAVAVETGGSLTVSGVISSTAAGAVAGVTKQGLGTLLLPSGTANSYRGATTISAGIVNIQNAASLGATNEGTTVASGATLQIEGGITVGAEALTINGSGAAGQHGALVSTGGDNDYTGTITLSGNASVSSEVDSLTLSGDIALGGITLITTGNGGQTVLSGNLSGTGGLDISVVDNAGAHTVTLNPAGSNSFNGATSITGDLDDDANLIVDGAGALAGTSSVSINTGGTLMFAGTGDRINDGAAFNLNDGAIRMGGIGSADFESVGALTLTATNSISIIDFQSLVTDNRLNFASSGSLAWTGALHIYNWGGLTLSQGGGSGSGLEMNQIFFGTSSLLGTDLTASQLSQITFFSDAGLTSLGATAFGANGQIVPVPEPTGVAAGLALFGLAGWRERRRSAARRRAERSARST